MTTIVRPAIDVPTPLAAVQLIHRPDGIAQEFPEIYHLRLIPETPLNFLSAVFLDTLCITIVDSDSETQLLYISLSDLVCLHHIFMLSFCTAVNVSFTSDSFRGFEADGSMQISVFKDARIATPISVLVQVFNVSAGNNLGILPSNLPDANALTSNYAECKQQ